MGKRGGGGPHMNYNLDGTDKRQFGASKGQQYSCPAAHFYFLVVI